MNPTWPCEEYRAWCKNAVIFRSKVLDVIHALETSSFPWCCRFNHHDNRCRQTVSTSSTKRSRVKPYCPVTIVKSLYLRNRDVSFVKICTVYVKWVIIKVARRKFDKMCQIDNDLYFGDTVSKRAKTRNNSKHSDAGVTTGLLWTETSALTERIGEKI